MFLYLILTLIMTYPLILNFTTHLGGDKGDGWYFMWNFWWTKEAIVELHQNPFHTDYIFHPTGVSLIYDDLSLTNGIFSIPLQYFFNLITVYNIILIFNLVISGFAMYLLVFYLTKNGVASFIGGIIFTFAPYHMAHALGHVSLVSMQWLPLYILFFMKSYKNYSVKNVLLAVLFLVLNALSCWYYLMMSLIFSGIYVLYFSIREKNSSILLKKITTVVGIFLLTGLVLSPILIPMINNMNQFPGGHNPEHFSADILSFFIPGFLQTIGHFDFFESITYRFTGNGAENSNYIGYAVLFLVLASIKKFWKKNELIRFFTLAAIIFFILALGMHIHFAGKIVNFPLPYFFLHKYVPGFSTLGVPERFDIMLVICLTIISSFAIASLTRISDKTKRVAIIFGISSLILIEFLFIPFTITSLDVPKFYHVLKDDPGDYAIIDLYPQPSIRLYYQTIHTKKIVGGYISRVPKDAKHFLYNTPIITNLFLNKEHHPIDKSDIEHLRMTTRTTLNEYNIKYVVIPKYLDDRLLRTYGLKKTYEDNLVNVYEAS